MKRSKRFLSFLLSTCLILISFLVFNLGLKVSAIGTDYYVSYSAGNDNNNGLTSSTPWQNLSKINSLTLSSGDRVFLKCGDTWTGQELVPKGDGTDSAYIEISSYGTGNKPIINSPSADYDTYYSPNISPDPRDHIHVGIKIKNYQGYKVTNIKITNAEYGIIATNIDRARSAGIWLENCEFNTISGGREFTLNDSPQQILKHSSAIYISGMDNINIKTINIQNVTSGILLFNMYGVYVDGVTIYNATQFGGHMGNVQNGYMKNSTINHIGYPSGVWNGVAGFVFSETSDILFEDNTIYDIYDPSVDGVAIDYEAKNRNLTVQRCLIYDCDSSAFLIYDGGLSWDNQIVNLIDNVIYNCGKRSSDTLPAFARIYGNTSCQGIVSGNKIKKYNANQEVFYNNGTLTDNYPITFSHKFDTIYSSTQSIPGTPYNPANGYAYIASSGFSSINGSNDWYYVETDGNNWYNMNYDSGNSRWYGSAAYSLIGINWQHPDTRDPARKWVCPKSGVISISGSVNLGATGGDGINIYMKKNSETLFSFQIAGNDTSSHATNYSNINVNAGDVIYFQVNKNGNNNSDSTFWNPTITWNNDTSWSSSSDFSNIQSYLGWTNTCYNTNAYNFDANTWDSGNLRWQGSAAYSLIAQTWQHPDTNSDSVRKWIAPRDGTINITGTANKATTGGNGVIIQINKNYFSGLYSLTINANDTSNHSTNASSITVKEGDTITFWVKNNGDSNSDSLYWSTNITYS